MTTPGTQSALAMARDPALSDDDVVRRVRAGETALYEVLMRRHNTRVYRAVRSVLRDEAEVEDVMQQTYLAAFSKLSQFTGASKFSTWLTSIALNEATNRLRRLARLRALPASEETSPGGTPESEADMHERVALVERAVDSLPDVYRTVVMLRVVQDLATEETAEVLGVTPDVVKTRLHRARAMLRGALERDLEGAAPYAFSFPAPRCNRVVANVLAALGSS